MLGKKVKPRNDAMKTSAIVSDSPVRATLTFMRPNLRTCLAIVTSRYG